MSDVASQIGQTRSKPDSDGPSSEPLEKKPKLERSSGNTKKLSRKVAARQKKRKTRHTLPEPYSSEDVLWHDVVSLLGKDTVDEVLEDGTECDSPFEFREEAEVVVSSLSPSDPLTLGGSATCSYEDHFLQFVQCISVINLQGNLFHSLYIGESLSLSPTHKRPWVIITPFALPGETIRVRIYRSARLHSYADLLEVVKPNLELRDQGRVKCKYFGECAGCQYQMLSYETQLDLKRTVVVKAYQNFSKIPPTSLPNIPPTLPSPLQYAYRTKITPHFEAPSKKVQRTGQADGGEKPEWLKIGFNHVGKRQVMDIEECPIATPVINEALTPMRENIIKNIHTYKKGVSLLLRDSLVIPDKTTTVDPSSDPIDTLSTSMSETHICITDHKATVRERVGSMLFEYPGGSFFQNNNSVLVPLTDYVRDAIFSSSSSSSTDTSYRPTHLVDAYCGSGLFSITLSPHFDIISGIELSSDSIKSATHNALLNNLQQPPGKLTFLAGDAANIFSKVQHFPREKTVLIIDPPRKGCDEKFIEQLVGFKAGWVVYVSCNVHTQARDVGEILRRMEEGSGREGGDGSGKYVLESLRGFDLFPQTAHVESIAVLRLI